MLNAIADALEEILANAADAFGFTADCTGAVDGMDFAMFSVASTPRPKTTVRLGDFAYRATSTEAWSRGAR